jgi:hypothetical protein
VSVTAEKRLAHLIAQHRVASANLAAIAARAEERRLNTARLQGETNALLDALREQSARADRLQRALAGSRDRPD